jgi:hypothetical protein
MMWIFAYNYGDYTALVPAKWVAGFYLLEAGMIPPIEVSYSGLR